MQLWILGSSTYGAQLAAELGLPYAFASHFAPDQLLPALDIYCRRFKPSAQLDRFARILRLAGTPVLTMCLLEKKQHHRQIDNVLILLARPEGFEPLTPTFAVWFSLSAAIDECLPCSCWRTAR